MIKWRGEWNIQSETASAPSGGKSMKHPLGSQLRYVLAQPFILRPSETLGSCQFCKNDGSLLLHFLENERHLVMRED